MIHRWHALSKIIKRHKERAKRTALHRKLESYWSRRRKHR